MFLFTRLPMFSGLWCIMACHFCNTTCHEGKLESLKLLNHRIYLNPFFSGFLLNASVCNKKLDIVNH